MRYRNARYPDQNDFYGGADYGEFVFNFVEPLVAALPGGAVYDLRYVVEEAAFQVFDEVSPSNGPVMAFPNGQTAPFNPIGVAPENMMAPGNEFFMSSGSVFSDGILGIQTMELSNSVSTTASWSMVIEISVNGGAFEPLSNVVPVSTFIFDPSLHDLTEVEDTPASSCFWTDKLGVSEDCGGGPPVGGTTFFRVDTTSDNAYNYPGGFNFVSNGDPCPFAPGVTFDLSILPPLLWIVGAWGTQFKAVPWDGTPVSCETFQAAITSGAVKEFTAVEPVPIYMRHYGAGINHIVQGHDTEFYNPLNPSMLPDALGRPDWEGGLGANYLVGIVVSDGTTEYRLLTTSTTAI